MAGRRPVPTALKVLRGNPGKRPLNRAEPKPTSGAPSCPKELDQDARKEWRRIVREFEALGMVTSLDRALLAVHCAAWSRWLKSSQEIQKHGYLVKAPSGYPIQNPYVAIQAAAEKTLRATGVEFGMSPASRSKVAAGSGGAGDATNPFAELAG
jgi:P27 family predicted phage terminase small subunit